jgi:hypothetical protein
VQWLHLHCFKTVAGIFIYVLTLGFHHIIQQEGQGLQLHYFNTVPGVSIQYLHGDFTTLFIHVLTLGIYHQSWATGAMKRCNEALNTSSLKFLC